MGDYHFEIPVLHRSVYRERFDRSLFPVFFYSLFLYPLLCFVNRVDLLCCSFDFAILHALIAYECAVYHYLGLTVEIA